MMMMMILLLLLLLLIIIITIIMIIIYPISMGACRMICTGLECSIDIWHVYVYIYIYIYTYIHIHLLLSFRRWNETPMNHYIYIYIHIATVVYSMIWHLTGRQEVRRRRGRPGEVQGLQEAGGLPYKEIRQRGLPYKEIIPGGVAVKRS